MMGVGVVLMVWGFVAWVGMDDGASPTPTTVAEAIPTEPTAASTTAPVPTTSTAPAPTTVAPTETTTTTTEASTTTITTVPEETLEGFVALFATALDDGDTEFIWSRLHPQVVEEGGEALCRDWVEREIMALSDYTLVDPGGPPETIAGIPNVVSATVSFVFQGQTFDDGVGQFSLVDGTFRWLGVCR